MLRIRKGGSTILNEAVNVNTSNWCNVSEEFFGNMAGMHFCLLWL